MIRIERRVATALALLALAGCAADPAPESQPPAAVVQTPAARAPADASRPNKVLDPAGWTDPRVREAYAAAKQYAHVLESIYCYCKCKENIGHRALVECFESDHGAHCDVCMTEAIVAARMTEQGKTPQEIQKAIDAYYGAS
jgi:hypothetical protein